MSRTRDVLQDHLLILGSLQEAPLPRPTSSLFLLIALSCSIFSCVYLTGCDKKKQASQQDGAPEQGDSTPALEKAYVRVPALDIPSFQQVEGCIPATNRKSVDADTKRAPLVLDAEAYLGLRPCIESISAASSASSKKVEDVGLLIGTRDAFSLLSNPVQGTGEVRIVPVKGDDGSVDSIEWIIQAESSDEAFKGAFSTVNNLYSICPEVKRRAALYGEAKGWAEDQDERLQSTSDVMGLLMDGATSDGFAVLCEDETRHTVQLYTLEPVSSHNGEIFLRRMVAYSVDAQDRLIDVYENLSNLRPVKPASWKP